MHFANPYLSRSTTWVVGLLAAALGILCIVWPGISIGVLVVVFAVFCFSDAIVQIERVIHPVGDRHRLGAGLLAIVDIIAGLYALAAPGIAAATLALIIGFWWIVSGVSEIGLMFADTGHRLGLLFAGLLSVAAGFVLVAWPALGAFSIALIFGFVLLFRGCGLLAMAWSWQRGDSSSGAYAGDPRAASL